jgi:hypothetical protein
MRPVAAIDIAYDGLSEGDGTAAGVLPEAAATETATRNATVIQRRFVYVFERET